MNPDVLYLAAFRFDVTPPPGHSLCGGWIEPVAQIDDPLEAIGFVLLSEDAPVVVCTLDWTGLMNEAYAKWALALAEAAGTTPDRVTIHCVHQHNAPFACLDSERFVAAQSDLPHIIDPVFFFSCLDRGTDAVKSAMRAPRRITHVSHGQAKVDKVASNRRIYRDEAGRIIATRDSNGPTEELRAMPEGLIDPWLKTVAFYCDGTKIAACHYYAVHPMSFYRGGRVSSDIAGLARKRRQTDEPDCLHLYFTGCAGNVAAGKYNDGSEAMRSVLAQRIYDGIVRSEEACCPPMPIDRISWRTHGFLPPASPELSSKKLQLLITNSSNSVVIRNRAAFMLGWLQRLERKDPLSISSLRLNNIALLHLPAECFVEYQLRAQQVRPDCFVATSAYGDGGPWYIPVKEEYPNGGYELSVTFCSAEIDRMLMDGIGYLLA